MAGVNYELITIYKFNTDCFYFKVFDFGFVHIKNSAIFASEIKKQGPFVYRLGRMVFIHVRAVRFRYGLQIINNYFKKPRKLFFEAFFIGFGCCFCIICSLLWAQNQRLLRSLYYKFVFWMNTLRSWGPSTKPTLF